MLRPGPRVSGDDGHPSGGVGANGGGCTVDGGVSMGGLVRPPSMGSLGGSPAPAPARVLPQA
eukprot:79011-Prymnesium_polylepis.1